MSRKPKYKIRECEPDQLYNSKVLSKFINIVMKDGKKKLAKTLVYKSIEELSKKTNKTPIESFMIALENTAPKMEVKSRRVGGSTYQVPIEVDKSRGLGLAMRWIIDFARNKSGSAFYERLSNELTDAFNKTGSPYKKREDTHKMAEANKAFAHFRW